MRNSSSSYINDAIFRDIIEHTPLVSLDLLVKKNDKFLLGKRRNKPAKGDWFTIGGRIFKNERLSDALKRIAKEELGARLVSEPKFVGPFEHIYSDGIYEGTSTHYINLLYEVELDNFENLPDEQHTHYRWFSIDQLLQDSSVNRYVKGIFLPNSKE